MVPVPVRRSKVIFALLALLSLPGGAIAQSPGDDPGLDPALAAIELMNRVPLGVMETCVPGSPSLPGQLAVAQCRLDADTVIYASFEDVASLTAAYAAITAGVTVEPDAVSCADGPFSGSYETADGTEAGVVICQHGDPSLLLAWTDVNELVLGVLALADEADFAVLHERWLRVRLDARANPMASPTPGVPVGSPSATGGPAGGITLWAVAAVASSEYGSDGWSASQATGEPDTMAYADQATAWAPAASEAGDEWIELTYERALVPAAVEIRETSGAGCVIRVEAWHEEDDEWVVLWEGTDPSPDELTVFSPPLDRSTSATKRIRITIDTGVPGWNEIDAVALVGTEP
jgi:hypothetical protein